MSTKAITQAKALRAQLMQLSGARYEAIADTLNCSVRTARRYCATTLPDEMVENLDGISDQQRARFLEVGWPLLSAMLDRLTEKVASDDLAARDLIAGVNTLAAQLQKFSPRQTITETQTETLTLNLFGPEEFDEVQERKRREALESSGLTVLPPVDYDADAGQGPQSLEDERGRLFEG